MGRSINVYSCTKQMQWLNVENLFSTTKADYNILVIIDHFPNAKLFGKEVGKIFSHWDEVVVLKDRIYLSFFLFKIKPKVLFIDSDYGFKGYLQSLLFNGDVFVYDEGLGSYYINTITKKSSLLKKTIFRILGAANFMGNHYKTKGIYLYNNKYYKSQYPNYKGKVFSFPLEYLNFFESNLSFLLTLFKVKDIEFLKIENSRIALYATYHTINDDILKELETNKNEYDFIFIKPHPHLLRNNPNFETNTQFTLILDTILLEILIIKLCLKNKLTVFHESSTGCLYFKETENLKFINYGGFYFPAFEEIL